MTGLVHGVPAVIVTGLALGLAGSTQADSLLPRIDLTGSWHYYADMGEAEETGSGRPPGQIQVPGAWQAQGYGSPGGSIPSSIMGSDITPVAYLRHNLTARCLYLCWPVMPLLVHLILGLFCSVVIS